MERDQDAGSHRLGRHIAWLGRKGRGRSLFGPQVGGHVAGHPGLGGIGLGELDGGHDVGGTGRQASRPEVDVRADPGELGGGVDVGEQARGRDGDGAEVGGGHDGGESNARAGCGTDRGLGGGRGGEERLVETG